MIDHGKLRGGTAQKAMAELFSSIIETSQFSGPLLSGTLDVL